MISISPTASPSNVIIGVDTHKYVHVAVALDDAGQRLGEHRIHVDTVSYQDLERWARSWGRVSSFGVEGTGSYGVGLAAYLRRQGHRVVEVNRGDRRARRANGKSDTLDAELAARSVLAGTSSSVPKSADGLVEMIRQIKVARDNAQKARTSAIVTLKTVVVNAPAEIREQLHLLGDKALIEKCAGFRLGKVEGSTSSTKHTLRSLARRWVFLDQEIKAHDAILNDLTYHRAVVEAERFGD